MDLKNYIFSPGEKPLDHMVTNGGFTGIFRTLHASGTVFLPVNWNLLNWDIKDIMIILNIPGDNLLPGMPAARSIIFPAEG